MYKVAIGYLIVSFTCMATVVPYLAYRSYGQPSFNFWIGMLVAYWVGALLEIAIVMPLRKRWRRQ